MAIYSALGVGSFILYRFCMEGIKSSQNQQKKIEEMEIYRPEELLQKLKNQVKNPYQAGVTQREIKFGEFFVQGVVGYASSSLYNMSNSRQLVDTEVWEYLHEIELQGDKKFVQKKKLKDVLKKHVESFYLMENAREQNQMNLQNQQQNQYQQQLQDQQFNQNQNLNQSPNFCVRVENFQDSVKIGVMKQVDNYQKINTKDYAEDLTKLAVGTALTIGLEQNQLGIEIGDSILAYGKAILDIEKMEVIFRNPSFLLKSKQQYLNRISSQNSVLIVFAGLMLIFTGYNVFCLGSTIFSWIKQKILGGEQQNNNNNQRILKELDKQK
ncbi:hypothetical protein PPERSA_05334 [Pseudocohnilembus persalinus]|uniref:Uncharacterized protein n=1 Tax=Pseudocohnilembus persalinus TaxID=266149 RepID=A0A0V0R604_PSEPJ|nr:hypothetical protein PPERSA_05334 [Pseudocohnilembus persalinus]|eukprot:KRX09942.1 hypothetical protein PPERSA_05334 [Pseudocohnilembus persalinus]